VIARSNQKKKELIIYEAALKKLESEWREIKRKGDVARFIYEELQLSPWNLTSEFIDTHKNAQASGSGMMKLTGFGDPSGRGEGFNFLRDDTKPNKTSAAAEGALKAQIKKITGKVFPFPSLFAWRF
jgi:transcription initiation factor TFIID subunit 1